MADEEFDDAGALAADVEAIYILTHAFGRQVFMCVFELLDFTDTELLSNSLCSLSALNGRNFTEHFFAGPTQG
ncbi:MAG: hypothetical protein ACI30P_04790, partial [Muribaculaceae bacterium]